MTTEGGCIGKDADVSLYQPEGDLSFRLDEAFLKESLPAKPYCTDNLADGLQIRSRDHALAKAYIQPNDPWNRRWLVYDLDRPGAYEEWLDFDAIPIPNIVAANPANGHAHYIYILKAPVYMQASAHERPKAYLLAIDHALTEALGADPSYAKLIAKNPFFAGWAVSFPNPKPYSLSELVRHLPECMPGAAALGGEELAAGPVLGRNCRLFEALRQFAYRCFKKHAQDAESWRKFLEAKARALNLELALPLPSREARDIAKSVAKWTWNRFSRLNLAGRQSARWQKSLATRQKAARHRMRALFRACGKEPSLSARSLAKRLLCDEKTVRNALKHPYMAKLARNAAYKAALAKQRRRKSGPLAQARGADFVNQMRARTGHAYKYAQRKAAVTPPIHKPKEFL